MSASERAEEERAAWRAQAQAEFPAEKLVFVDERGCKLALTPLYGWAPRNRGPNARVRAALSAEGVLAAMRIEGPANTEVFLSFLDQVRC